MFSENKFLLTINLILAIAFYVFTDHFQHMDTEGIFFNLIGGYFYAFVEKEKRVFRSNETTINFSERERNILRHFSFKEAK